MKQRLREIAEADSPVETRPIDDVINAYLTGARDQQTRELAQQVVAEHREFFDLNGDR